LSKAAGAYRSGWTKPDPVSWGEPDVTAPDAANLSRHGRKRDNAGHYRRRSHPAAPTALADNVTVPATPNGPRSGPSPPRVDDPQPVYVVYPPLAILRRSSAAKRSCRCSSRDRRCPLHQA
jgi:hypothetical protein